MAVAELRADSARDNIIPFPAHIAVMERIRFARRMVAQYQHYIDTCDPDSKDLTEAMRARMAPALLADYESDLVRLLAELASLEAGSALQFNGVVYTEMAGRA